MGMGIGAFGTAQISSGGVTRYLRTSRTKSSGTKKKSLNYDYRELSNFILHAKTPNGAGQAVIKAKQKLGELLRKTKTGESGEEEIDRAIAHVRKMERIARKKKKHLEQEEEAKKGKGFADVLPGGERKETDETREKEQEEEFSEDLELRMRQMQEKLEQLEKEMREESGENFMELEVSSAAGKLSPEEQERLKKRHRNDEWKDIVKADMEYLKSKFGQLEKEKREAASGVSLELYGQPQPVMPMVSEGSEAAGAAVDVEA